MVSLWLFRRISNSIWRRAEFASYFVNCFTLILETFVELMQCASYILSKNRFFLKRFSKRGSPAKIRTGYRQRKTYKKYRPIYLIKTADLAQILKFSPPVGFLTWINVSSVFRSSADTGMTHWRVQFLDRSAIKLVSMMFLRVKTPFLWTLYWRVD